MAAIPARRSSLIAALGVLALVLALPPTSGAQPVLFNNYNHLPTGEAAALQGGAFIARANDASAGWYNPAGLARARHDALSGNASLYAVDRVTFDGAGPEDSYSTTPTFIGSVSRSAGGDGPGRAWGFSIVTPLDTDNNSKRNLTQDYSVSGGALDAQDVNTVIADSSQATLFAPGLAWGRSLGDATSFGYGLRLYQLNLDGQTGLILFQDPGSPENFSAVENIAFSFEMTLARLEAGWQWWAGASLRVGLVVRSGTAELRTRGRVLTNFQSFFDPGTPINSFATADDEDTGLSYKLPWEVGLGIAWVRPGWELELDVLYYHDLEPFKLVEPIDVLVITQVGSTPTQTTIQEPGVTFDGRSFVNAALGGRLRVGKAWWLNGGVYSDRSPGTFEGNALFNEVDFTGVTLGTTHERPSGSTTLGLVYLTGAAEVPFEATPSIVPTPPRTVEIGYRSLAFIIAGTVHF